MNRTVEMVMNRNGVTIRRVLHSLQNLYSTAAGLLKAFVLQVVSQATKSYLCNCMMTIVKTAPTFHLTFKYRSKAYDDESPHFIQ